MVLPRRCRGRFPHDEEPIHGGYTMTEKALAPIEQKEVAFYEDTVTAVLVEERGGETVYVPVRPICELLGIDWSSQRRRINRDAVLDRKVRSVVVMTTDRGARETLCLPLEYLNGWLFGINADRVRPEIRARLIRYQEDCYLVLATAFREGRLTTSRPTFEDILAQADPATVQAYQMAQAIVQLARNQVELEARIAGRLENYERRLETIEAQMGDSERYVTQDQASQISQSVKAIALKLGDRSGRNEFGGVYGELYRRFGITSYKQLPNNRFEEAMRFLTDWHQRLAGEAAF